MIIWKGRGIFILVIGAIGAAAALGLFAAITHRSSPEWSAAIGMTGFAVGAWVCALTFCKPEHRTLVDPATRRPVILTQIHDLYFVSARTWAIGSSVIAMFAFFIAKAVGPPDEIPASAPMPTTKARSAFDRANALISTYKEKEAFGNKRAAEQLGQEFSAKLASLRDVAITKGNSPLVSASKGHFLTYCHIASDGIAFMVHVPELRNFTQGAKDAIMQLAWVTASVVTKELNPPPVRIAVGIRGAILYDRAWVGSPGATVDNPESSIQYHSVDSDDAKSTLANFIENIDKGKSPAFAAKDKDASTSPAAKPEPERPAVAPKMTQQAEPAATAQQPAPATSSPPAAPALPSVVREWKDNTGRPLRASLEKFITPTLDTAEFKREDGQTFQIQVNKFSAEDQAFIAKIVEQLKAADKAK